MSDLRSKMVAQCFTTDEVICFSMNIPGNVVESNEENVFREEGGAKVDPADVSGSDSDCPEENVEEVNKPSTSRGRVCGCGRKLRCGSGGGMG